MNTPLAEKIKSIIQTTGPISIADYFTLCLGHPEHGYYQSRDPFGHAGDFITAPDISQLFGEMIGLFLINSWQSHGSPTLTRLVEIGPGRATMMADILRVIGQLSPALHASLTIHLVETSQRLRQVQAETLANHINQISWHDDLEDIAPGPLLIVANEFFDAVAIRQFIKTRSGFRERMIGLNESGELAFTIGAGGLDAAYLPTNQQGALGDIIEISPAREAIMDLMAQKLSINGGTALIIDYGHLERGFGDTFQAILKHRFDDVLAHPGLADLTSHVDFSALAEIAKAAGMHVNGLMTQGAFLLSLGIVERAGRLGADKGADVQQQISQAVRRLAGTGPQEMGALFKVLAISNPAIALWPFDA